MSWTPPWETSERDLVRRSFDHDAGAYDRSRPVAPSEVFDDLIDLAGLRPGALVFEIGPGTGQATRPLAEKGLHILALELGPNLARLARQNLASFRDVEVVNSSFEEWQPVWARFDAVMACNSFHWLDPAVRSTKCAAVLRPGGHLAVLATPWVIPDDADWFWWDVQDDYEAVGLERVEPATMHPDRAEHIGADVLASGLFEEPIIRRRLFALTFTADDYALNLSTQSFINMLPADTRNDLISRIRRRIVDKGGTITTHLLALLSVARVRQG